MFEVRRIDELGRVEIRERINVEAGAPMISINI
jgi:hypothetical protein